MNFPLYFQLLYLPEEKLVFSKRDLLQWKLPATLYGINCGAEDPSSVTIFSLFRNTDK
jgi:hypothetical protein